MYTIPIYSLTTRDKPSDNKYMESSSPSIGLQQRYLKTIKGFVRSAIQNDDDIFIITDHTENLSEDDISFFAERMIELIADHVFMLQIIDNPSEIEGFQVSPNLYYTSKFSDLTSFVISKPLYKFILELDEDEVQNPILGPLSMLESLFNRVVPVKYNWCLQTVKLKVQQRDTINFKIVVTFRNAEEYIGDCIKSILCQDYNYFHVFLIDDCSSDNGIPNSIVDDRLTIIKNDERKYALHNICEILSNDNSYSPEDIIVLLDGDDCLANKHVLSLLIYRYSKHKCLLTHGSFRFFNSLDRIGGEYSKTEFKKLREAPWKASHLKTFKYSLFKEYLAQDQDLMHMKDENGAYYKMTYDMALMLPLIEIAGFDRILFIEDILYKYRLHDNNDHNVDRNLQFETELTIRSKKSFLAFQKE